MKLFLLRWARICFLAVRAMLLVVTVWRQRRTAFQAARNNITSGTHQKHKQANDQHNNNNSGYGDCGHWLNPNIVAAVFQGINIWTAIPFLLLALCGCASQPITTPAVSMAGRGAVLQAAPALPKPLYLVWNNPNSNQQWPALQCEIHSTTNLLKSFRLFTRVGAWTNCPFYPTNGNEFFIARFIDPISGVTSEWNVK